MYNGIINVYKEKGFTSFDVVAKLRGILKQKKIGHTGTLDPDAEGVLVVCLGNATKLCDMLTDKDKKYEARLLLGMTSDTEDSSGTILEKKPVTASEQEVREAVLSFVGEYDQIPPMYSAIKVNGKKLYELARQGIEIERLPRHVEVYDIDITEIDLPYVSFFVTCSKGTYIRSLCRDIGQKLSCGGLMDGLIRRSVNISDTGMVFDINDSLKLSEIEKLVEESDFENHILTIDKMFPDMKKVLVNDRGSKRLMNGNVLFKNDFTVPDDDSLKEQHFSLPDKNDCLIYNTDRSFKAIYRYDDKTGGWKAFKMFL